MTASHHPTAIADASSPPTGGSLEVVFAPVRSQTAFEETVDRLGTAIKLGLLPPGTRLPAERELCERLGIARSTLRQALVTLGRSGHLHALRGRGGGTFVADPLPAAAPPSAQLRAHWREVCDERRAVEVGIAQLAAERAHELAIEALERFVLAMDSARDDFTSYRHLDVRLHVGVAELTGSARLVARMTEIEGSISGLISNVEHSPEVLDVANDQHRRLVEFLRRGDGRGAGSAMAEHTRGTEHLLAAAMLPGA